jgi:heme-degrading monooxygenase HmoA
MIARIWRGRTRPEHANEYWKFLTGNAEDDCRRTTGNCGVHVYRKVTADYAEFLFVSFWESLEAVRNYAGDDIDKAHYFPEDLRYVIDPPATVDHYQVFSV